MNPSTIHRRQHGAAAVEFAIVAGLLVTLLLGIVELSRLMFYWNTATELTRLGARIAVVCGMDDAAIKSRMQALFPLVSDAEIDVDYLPAGCNINTCLQVRVSIVSSRPIDTYIPYLSLTPVLPPFSTTLPRESMKSAIDMSANPVCG